MSRTGGRKSEKRLCKNEPRATSKPCLYSTANNSEKAFLFLSLKRRFQQAGEDVSYTITTLIPTLGQQILAEMDVESVTNELQARSRAPKSLVVLSPPVPSESSSVDIVQDHDAHSEAGSVSVSSFSGSGKESNIGESSQSWVDPLSPRQEGRSRLPSNESGPIPPEIHFPEILQGTHLSESISTTDSAMSHGLDGSSRVRQTVLYRFWRLTLSPPILSRKAWVPWHRMSVPGVKPNYGRK
jgi:hypothetical protein